MCLPPVQFKSLVYCLYRLKSWHLSAYLVSNKKIDMVRKCRGLYTTPVLPTKIVWFQEFFTNKVVTQ